MVDVTVVAVDVEVMGRFPLIGGCQRTSYTANSQSEGQSTASLIGGDPAAMAEMMEAFG